MSAIRILIIIILNFFLAQIAASQNPDYLWGNTNSGNRSDYSESINTDNNNNIIVTGYFKSQTISFGTYLLTNADSSGNTYDFYIVKYDPQGNVLWARSAGGNADDGGISVTTDLSGNIILSGYFMSSTIAFESTVLTNANSGSPDIFLLKYDLSGNLIWAKREGNNNWDYGNCVALDANNNILLTGRFGSPTITFGSTTLYNSSTSISNPDIFIVKYNSSGTVMWAKSAGGTSNDDASNIAVDANGNIFISGYFQSSSITFGTHTLINSGGRDVFLTKFDPTGNCIWAKGANGVSDERCTGLSIDLNNNIFVTGYYYSTSLAFDTVTLTRIGNFDIFIAKYDNSGNVMWVNSAGGIEHDFSDAVTVDSSGNAILTGYFTSPSITFETTTLYNTDTNLTADIFIVKYNPTGSVLWAESAGGISNDYGISVSGDKNSSICLTGYFFSPVLNFGSLSLTNSSASYSDIFIVKIDFLENIKGNPKLDPAFIIYPNPSVNELKFEFSEEQNFTFNLLDISGHILVKDISLTAEKTVNISTLKPGLYFIEGINSGNNIMKKFIKY